ncbi:DUF2834 domain-containing protein [Mycobacterium sp. 852002-51057_SCH5723018]|uniref:DUF2834 domain-containing protein n=1 Tax=Mycobacterium sp. 852002-51057_SCH5723018 TaxID=1834094 RepID=UPI0007FC07AF|nr:DUF2834 domain-containing protein [Mycobacterium sp. 852002-51057_SCH5723018]OBG23229.1 hypothetical protein A5764_11685 [Mycobacterium sp. 852002-51057_SCH5723018]
MPTSRKVLCVIYGVIAVAALIACWSQTVAYVHSPTDFFVNFWRDAKVTAASRNITADALMLGIAVVILMVIEARKHKVRFVWAYVAACYFIAISVAFPLFLIARELRLGASEPPRLHAADTVLLAVLAVAFGALTIWIDVP